MMMNKKKILSGVEKLVFVILLLFFVSGINAQEVVVPLEHNSMLSHYYSNPSNNSVQSTTKQLLLPFIEDFSSSFGYPAKSHWADSNVYVNNDYPYNPPSVNVATFDAIDAKGWVYDHAASYPFTADTLTSKAINLSGLSIHDSVFMSFCFQPGGIGNSPERDDSLVLQFFIKSKQQWKTVWAAEGMKLDDFRNLHGDSFDYVLLQIDSTHFFTDDFRFRFYNYASITDYSLPDWGGNVDMWHLDYIFIDKNRSRFDTLINFDVTFRDYPKSLLNTYFSMPWNQFLINPAKEMSHDVSIPYSSYYYGLTSTINQKFDINVLTGGTSYVNTSYNYGNLVMPVDSVVIAKPGSGFQSWYFNSTTPNYAEFELKAVVAPFNANELIVSNDTVIFYQRFYNYYAYDDGSAEAGYGLSASNPNTNMKMAYRFDLNTDDTLQAVSMFFNQTKDQANAIFFNLVVWENNSGQPGDTLYYEEDLKPVFLNGINRYHTYELQHPVPVSGSFFVGWEQNTGTHINLGFDLNRDASDKVLFNIGAGWALSQYAGAPMIRPVMGDSAVMHVGMEEEKPDIDFAVVPNPVSYEFEIVIGDVNNFNQNNWTIQIFDLSGRLQWYSPFQYHINADHLQNGLYLLVLRNVKQGDTVTKRLLIHH
jgi:hypothetical protein